MCVWFVRPHLMLVQHKLEEAIQLTVGNEGYMLFTLDKVIGGFLRQLKSVVEDASSLKMLQLFKVQVKTYKGQYMLHTFKDNNNGCTK